MEKRTFPGIIQITYSDTKTSVAVEASSEKELQHLCLALELDEQNISDIETNDSTCSITIVEHSHQEVKRFDPVKLVFLLSQKNYLFEPEGVSTDSNGFSTLIMHQAVAQTDDQNNTEESEPEKTIALDEQPKGESVTKRTVAVPLNDTARRSTGQHKQTSFTNDRSDSGNITHTYFKQNRLQQPKRTDQKVDDLIQSFRDAELPEYLKKLVRRLRPEHLNSHSPQASEYRVHLRKHLAAFTRRTERVMQQYEEGKITELVETYQARTKALNSVIEYILLLVLSSLK